MELEEFVSATLTGIVRGVRRAQHEIGPAKGLDHDVARIVPQTVMEPGGQWDHAKTATRVEFDLAVSEESSRKTEGRAGVQILKVVDLGTGGESQASTIAQNRIRFHVPVALPPHPTPEPSE